MGSGSTRVLLAQVNICTQKIIQVIYKDEQAVPYRDSLVNGALSPETMKMGRELIESYMIKAQEAGAVKVVAVATEVFRKAPNGSSFISKLQKELNLDISVIDQEREARLGYLSALTQIENTQTPLVVWDMGGGSTQIIAKEGAIYNYFFPKFGAVAFKEFLIKEIQKKDPDKIKSPNPISSKQGAAASSRVASALNKIGVPVWLEAVLKRANAKVYGIGGVHYYSIREQVNNKTNSYTAAEVSDAVRKQLGKTDKQLGGEYANTQVSNLLLIKGFLAALKIPQVETLKVNLTQGLLFE